MSNSKQSINATYVLLICTGILFLASAVFYPETLLGYILGDAKANPDLKAIAQSNLLRIGLGLLVGVAIVSRFSRASNWFGNPIVTNILLSVLTLPSWYRLHWPRLCLNRFTIGKAPQFFYGMMILVGGFALMLSAPGVVYPLK